MNVLSMNKKQKHISNIINTLLFPQLQIAYNSFEFIINGDSTVRLP